MRSYHYNMTQIHFIILLIPTLMYLTIFLDGSAEEATIWWKFLETIYNCLYVRKGKFLV